MAKFKVKIVTDKVINFVLESENAIADALKEGLGIDVYNPEEGREYGYIRFKRGYIIYCEEGKKTNHVCYLYLKCIGEKPYTVTPVEG